MQHEVADLHFIAITLLILSIWCLESVLKKDAFVSVYHFTVISYVLKKVQFSSVNDYVAGFEDAN